MLKANERIDDLFKENLKIIQNDDVFSFSTDALLLGHFTEVRKNDKILDLAREMVLLHLCYQLKDRKQLRVSRYKNNWLIWLVVASNITI